jgi:hypothetical protein
MIEIYCPLEKYTASFVRTLRAHPEYGGSTQLYRICEDLPEFTASYTRRQLSSITAVVTSNFTASVMTVSMERLVEALRYKPEGREFEKWCQWALSSA